VPKAWSSSIHPRGPLAHGLEHRLARDGAVLGTAEDLPVRRGQLGRDLVEDAVRVLPELVDDRLQVGGERLLRLGRRGELGDVSGPRR
jgi:hypothetical protein